MFETKATTIMNSPPKKRLCVVIPLHLILETGSISKNEKSDISPPLPLEDIKLILAFCDLSTRSKLRRVCHQWKTLVTGKIVNETVLLDSASVLLVRAKPPKLNAQHIQRDCFVLCEVFPSDLPAANSRHRRYGFLGPHVRTVIYSGCQDPHYLSYLSLMRLVGLLRNLCPTLQELLFWRAAFLTRPMLPSTFPNQLPHMVPRLSKEVKHKMLNVDTVLSFVCLPGKDGKDTMQCGDFYEARRKVAFYTTPPGKLPERTYSREQVVWVARHAPRLPPHYHKWTEAQIQVYSFATGEPVPLVGGFKKFKLGIINYTMMDEALMRILAYCILKEKLPYTDEPPSPFL